MSLLFQNLFTGLKSINASNTKSYHLPTKLFSLNNRSICFLVLLYKLKPKLDLLLLLLYFVLLSLLVLNLLTDHLLTMRLPYGTLCLLKCANLLLLHIHLTLLICLFLLFHLLSFTIDSKLSSFISLILLSLLYMLDGYSSFRPGFPFISSSLSITHIHHRPFCHFIYG